MYRICIIGASLSEPHMYEKYSEARLYIYIDIYIHRTSYRNFLYIPRYQNGRRSRRLNNRQRLALDCTLASAHTQTIHTSFVTKCSVLCVGYFSYGYGSNCQRGTPAREHERDRRASETIELREERLCVQRERDRTRRAARSKEE